MKHGKKVVALIPCRSGSKRLPNKYVLDLGGKRLVDWTAEEALKSKYIDTVYISTNMPEILKDEREYKRFPFYKGCLLRERPAGLCQDKTSMPEIVEDFIKFLNINDYLIVLLYSNCPFRTAKQIDEALDLFFEKNAKSLQAVVEVDYRPMGLMKIDREGYCVPLVPRLVKVYQSQAKPFKQYRAAGAMYIFDPDELKNLSKQMFNAKTLAYILPESSAVDIDTADDLEMARRMLLKKEFAYALDGISCEWYSSNTGGGLR